ncbi:MAG: transglutaminase family protein [Proteobacteria bacterium]|nr:transglutaminase family protein [Pseudomonadota bacterium]
MRYEITVKLEYDYARTATLARHVLHLMPRTVEGMQRVIAASLAISPRAQSEERRQDFFGNTVHALHYREEHNEIEITLRARVERHLMLPSLDVAPPLPQLAAELAAWTDLGPDSPLHFLSPSPRVPDVTPFRAFAQGLVTPEMTTLEAMRAIAKALHARMTFDDEATEVDTPPEEAFRKGRGVCQDYSHIMIACCRAIGLPAGYVSGLLRTIPPPGQERLPGSDAMHAWVRVWCGAGIGWREYDPTNALDVTDDHVLVAYGRDYADVAPIRGVSRTAGGHSGRHSVDVVPLD